LVEDGWRPHWKTASKHDGFAVTGVRSRSRTSCRWR